MVQAGAIGAAGEAMGLMGGECMSTTSHGLFNGLTGWGEVMVTTLRDSAVIGTWCLDFPQVADNERNVGAGIGALETIVCSGGYQGRY